MINIKTLEYLNSLYKLNANKTRLHINQATLVPVNKQEGSELQPFSTIQGAINYAVANGVYLTWHLILPFGDYTNEILTIPPGFDFVIEGVIRRGPMTLGVINWTVTGDRTSRLGLRNLRAINNINIIDGPIPAVNAAFTVENCEIGSVTGKVTSNNSFITFVVAGSSDASSPIITTPVVQSVIRGDVELPNSLALISNTQLGNTCTKLKCGKLVANGCSFQQNIEITHPTIPEVKLRDCIWQSTNPQIKCTHGNGKVTLDAVSNAALLVKNGKLVDSVKNNLDVQVNGTAIEPVDSSLLPVHNSISPYLTFVIGSQTDSNYQEDGNGGLYAGARSGLSNEAPIKAPYSAFSSWDWGSGIELDQGRSLYYGGGDWEAPDANNHQFYTSPAYDETLNAGLLRMHVASTGAVKVGPTAASGNALFQVDGAIGGTAAYFSGGSIQINDHIRLTNIISPPTLTGTRQDNYNPIGLENANIIRISITSNTDISGISGGVNGRILTLFNVATNRTFRLLHQSTNSLAENRFILPNNSNYVCIENSSVSLFYDGISALWRLWMTKT